LARILGCLPLPFTVSLDRSCEDIMLVINECCLQTCFNWIFFGCKLYGGVMATIQSKLLS
jgi:hypothetical protein